jgi:hypothetical protein
MVSVGGIENNILIKKHPSGCFFLYTGIYHYIQYKSFGQ